MNVERLKVEVATCLVMSRHLELLLQFGLNLSSIAAQSAYSTEQILKFDLNDPSLTGEAVVGWQIAGLLN
jgi:hypothetical protein